MFDDDGTCLVCGMEDATEDHFHDAEIIRDGWRGQYLAPTFVLDAYALLEREEDALTRSASLWLDEMACHIDAHTHAEDDDYEIVMDSMLSLESDLDSAGFVVHMDDGYVIWRLAHNHSTDTLTHLDCLRCRADTPRDLLAQWDSELAEGR